MEVLPAQNLLTMINITQLLSLFVKGVAHLGCNTMGEGRAAQGGDEIKKRG